MCKLTIFVTLGKIGTQVSILVIFILVEIFSISASDSVKQIVVKRLVLDLLTKTLDLIATKGYM
jgi:hypothetical protein